MLMIKHFNDINEHTKHVLDGASIATVLGTLANILPAMAALFTVVWTAIRIYETKTFQDMMAKWKNKNAE
jgi:hypothetical protein